MKKCTPRKVGLRGQRSELAGIYALVCSTTGKLYIGSSIKLSSRIKSHFRLLKQKRHHSIKLQRAFDRYGEDVFQIVLLEYITPSEFQAKELISAEQKWINRYNSANLGYNISPSASSSSGIKRTEEMKELVASYHRKRYRVFSPSGELFDVTGLSRFAKSHGLNGAALSQVALGKVIHHKGWRAEYWDKPLPKNKRGDIGSAQIDGMIPSGRGPYRMISQSGEVVIVQSIAQFSKERGLSQKRLSATASKIKHSGNWHKGWRCEKVSSPTELAETIYIVTLPSGEEVTTRNLSDFCRQNGLNKSSLSRVLNGHAANHRGYSVRVKGKDKPIFQAYSRNTKNVRWQAISPEGIIYEFTNLKRFCLQHGLTGPLMHNVSRGIASNHKGWRCIRLTPLITTA